LDHHPVFSFDGYFSFTLLAATPQGTTILVISLLVLLLISFVISGAEVAMFSLTHRDINMLKTKQHPAAKRIINLLDERKEVYTSLLIANTFFNICIIILANFLISSFIKLGKVHFLIDFDLDMIVRVLLVVFVVVFFGKVFPKVWATQNNIRFAYGAAFLVEALHLLLGKISKRMVVIADGIGKRLGTQRSQAATLKELDQAIDITTDEETSEEEKNILKGIVKFGNISVKQIMKARLDVSGIEYHASFHEVLKKTEELHYSRLPVYKGNMDEVMGILNTKDLIAHLHETDIFEWRSLIRQPYFVPESKLIEDLLKDFQTRRIHFAVVVDEFGGTSGIVTLEDILEEIIGDIKDEFDDEEAGFRKLDENNYIFEGKTMIHDTCKVMNLPLDIFDEIRGDSESLAGLVLELAGEFPAKNSVVSAGDFDFTVLESDKNRILQVKVTINHKEKV
jgi:putative hemolysin